MRFVYVEDNLTVQRQTALWLRYERHDVTVFENAIDALNHLRTVEPDVLLCDYKLDVGPDGLVLASHVRQLYPDCTIVMVSHYAEKPEFERGYGLGVDDFVSRPVPHHVLLDRIWQAVQRRRAHAPPSMATKLVSGPLIMDVNERWAMLDGELLPLTPSQFDILQHLVSRPGQPVSFSDLGAHVWGERLDRKAARRRLKTHVLNLRAKLEQHEAVQARILSLRGYGYRWAPEWIGDNGVEAAPD